MLAVPLADAAPTVPVALVAMQMVLIGTVAQEMRRAPDDAADASPGRATLRVRIGFVVLMLLAVGVGVALRMAIRPPVALWEQIGVGIALACGLFAAIALHFLPAGQSAPPPALQGAAVAVLAAAAIVAVPGSSAGDRPAGRLYRVTGTCANRDCGLNAHTAPSRLAPIPGHKPAFEDGDAIRLVCWRLGGSVSTRSHVRSDRWDRLVDGRWVSDLFVEAASPSATLRRCEP